MKQTAVNWMANELLYLDNEFDMGLIDKNEFQAKRKEIIEKAKQMEKQQIMKAYKDNNYARYVQTSEIEKYYNETFKSE